MDPSFVGYVRNASKCRKLSLEEKRSLVYQISKWSDGGPRILESWSRNEILQILAAELGKERKLSSWPKIKIIDFLLRTVAEKSKGRYDGADQESEQDKATTSKRQRKTDNPSRLHIPKCDDAITDSKADTNNAIYCQNVACRAVLCEDDGFCKRCTCFICHKYDESKDPSLWFVCSSTHPVQGDPCSMSCHIECALKDKRAGTSKYNFHGIQEGTFCCMSCGKINDLHRCYHKLLLRAKESRCINIMFSRLSLCQELLKGNEKFHKVYEIVNTAITKLEALVGPIASRPVKMANGAVIKLSSAEDIQNLCSSALESLLSKVSSDALMPDSNYNMPDSGLTSSGPIQFENVSPTSLPSEGDESNNLSACEDQINNQQENYIRKAEVPDADKLSDDASKDLTDSNIRSTVAKEKEPPECSGSALNDECLIQEVGSLPIATIYPESEQIVPTLTKENQVSDILLPGEELSSQRELPPDIGIQNELSTPVGNGMEIVPFEPGSDGEPPSTRRKLSFSKDEPGRNGKAEPTNNAYNNHVSEETEKQPGDGSFSKKRSARSNQECNTGESLEKEYECCVKKIRWLELEGYLEKNFRLKFLTWYSLWATPEEKRIVKVYVDMMADDPVSLSRQLVHSFSERIFCKRASGAPHGFCTRLWH